MTMAEPTSLEREHHFIVSNNINDLTPLRDDQNLNFGVLTRDSLTFQNSIEELLTKSSGKTNFTYCASEDIDLIGALLDEKFDLQSDCSLDFYSDIMNVAKMFINLTKSKLIGIQLEVVNHSLCRFFHTDKIPYRLITTYKGPTTEWLTNSNVNRNELGKHLSEGVFKDESKIQYLPEFSLGFIKGETLLPGASLVHRSPVLQNKNEKRLIMRMDSLEF